MCRRNLASKRGVPSSRRRLCPTGYSTSTSSSTVPLFSSMSSAFPIERFSGLWYSWLKRLSSTQWILARSESIVGQQQTCPNCRRQGLCEWKRNKIREGNGLALRVEVSVDERVRDHLANCVTMHNKQDVRFV